MNHQRRRTGRFSQLLSIPALLSVLFGLFGIQSNAAAAANWIDEVRKHPAIPLLDEEGKHVLDSGKPYSAVKSCGEGSGCHDYQGLTHAFHFQQGRDEAADDFGKKRGAPWLVTPGYFGGYNCMTGNDPAMMAKKKNATAADLVDYGTAGWITLCGYCHAGGGWGEFDRDGIRYDKMPDAAISLWDGDYYNRVPISDPRPAAVDGNGNTDTTDPYTKVIRMDWKQSGVEEADCIMCHVDLSALRKFPESKFPPNATKKYSGQALFTDMRVYKYQDKEHFRLAGSAILEFLDVKNYGPNDPPGQNIVAVKKTFFDPNDEKGWTPELDSAGRPQLTWNPAAFDQDRKVTLPMLRFPDNENCMQCHLTASSRRAFYGYGSLALLQNGPNGVLIDNYKGDVHEGKVWKETNGQDRVIDNCNACHARNYYNEPFRNVELNVDHNFLKGKDGQDVRNDLDNQPGPKTCRFCHNDSPNHHLANPSTKNATNPKSLTAIHQERWTMAGDMAGYTQSSLAKITQTHMDIVSCESCHITHLRYPNANTPLQKAYRYREDEYGKGRQEIVPYKPATRYLWIDKTSGRALTNTERAGVIKKIYKADGKTVDHGDIMDPLTGQKLGQVIAASAGGNFSDANETYEAYVAFKKALDNLLIKKGYTNPNVRIVWNESNQYLISHNARPSVEALPCADCHEKKQNGSYSSLLSDTGIWGKEGRGVITVVSKIADKRLVDEGLMEFAKPYMKLTAAKDAKGADIWTVTESVADILAYSRENPSMSVFNDDIADVAGGAWLQNDLTTALDKAHILDTAGKAKLGLEVGSDPLFQFDPVTGKSMIRRASAFAPINTISQALFPLDRVELASRPANGTEINAAAGSGVGLLKSEVFAIRVTDQSEKPIGDLRGQRIIVKLPYLGALSDAGKVKLLEKSGSAWSNSGITVLHVFPHSELADGYALIATTRPLENVALADELPPAPTPPPSPTPAPPPTPTAGSGATTPDPTPAPAAPTCVTASCQKAVATATKSWQAKSNAANKAQRTADRVALRAARASGKKKAALEAAARRAAARAASAKTAADAAYVAMRSLSD